MSQTDFPPAAEPAPTRGTVYADLTKRKLPAGAPAGVGLEIAAPPSPAAKYLTEFVGTFFLVLTIGLVIVGSTTAAPIVLAPLAIGSALMIMVYMGGHVSGGHYNPAVSLAVLMRAKISGLDFIAYMIAQFAGAIVAALAVYYVLGKTFAPAPAETTTLMRAVFVEFLFTFALALVVLNVATAPRTVGNSYYGLAIGFTVTVGAIAGGGISGGAFNPAVGVAPAIIHATIGEGSLGHLWIYLAGPFAGAAVAATVYRFQNGRG